MPHFSKTINDCEIEKGELTWKSSFRYLFPANCLRAQHTDLKCYISELAITKKKLPMLVCLCFREKPEEIIVRPKVS